MYTVERDNGIALSTVCNAHNNKHLKCLKHFLTSLGLDEFSKEVGELVSAKCIKDFNTLCAIYSEQFSKASIEKINNLQKMLGKAGLAYLPETKKIIVADTEKWDAISQIERIKYSMPSTTNALESSHGHLNSQIPRRNNFWSAMLRLTKYVLRKEYGFNESLIRNYQREKRIIKKTAKDNSSIIDKQIQYYNTTPDKCECGETSLLSKMFRVKIACSHIFSITNTFAELPDIKLETKKNANDLKLHYEITKLPETATESSLEQKIQNKAVKTIRRFSHFKQEKLIRDAVSTLRINEDFANGLPTSYHETVSSGISKFCAQNSKVDTRSSESK